MVNLLKVVWDFMNTKVFMYILIISGIGLFMSMCSSNNNLKDSISLKNDNIEALNDSVTNIILKNGDLQSEINGFQGSTKQLEILNKSLAEDIEKEKGKVVTYSNIIFKLNQTIDDLELALNQPIFVQPTATSDSTWNVDWTLPYIYDSVNYDIFHGRTKVSLINNMLTHDKTFLLNRDSQMKLTWGQKYEDGKLKVFARTSHPAFEAQFMEGVYVDIPKDRHWFQGFGVGPQIGVSLFPTQTLYFGIGVHYNIYKW